MTRILRLTDTHVGKTKKEAANLTLIVEYILNKFGSEKMIILNSGDLVDDGNGDIAIQTIVFDS
ncbi:MAG: hypothetical protein GY943_15310 [Chloroflexi bacterium]|nr:hypothetical protein [Chloroflexota bacterium]